MPSNENPSPSLGEQPPSLPVRPPEPEVELLDSQVLFKGHHMVQIVHQGAVYQLRATRQGKLILTK